MKMRTRMSSAMVRAMLIVALVLGLVPRAEAQTVAAKGKPAAARTKSQASAKPSGGQQEGIKVHGHWTIEVRNPDGSLASHTEFENALTPGGQYILVNVLVSAAVVGEWRITLGDATGAGPCELTSQVSGSLQTFQYICSISETGTATPYRFPNLTKAVSSNNQLELSGTATATYPFSVSLVRTVLMMCRDPNMSPVVCKSTGGSIPGGNVGYAGDITSHSPQNPVSVVAGQIIQVKVVLSFS